MDTLPFSLVVPTLNAAGYLPAFLEAVKGQALQPSELLFLDSDSSDGTAAMLRRAGARVIPIPRGTFDHGGTRNLGVREAQHDLVLFMSQDVLPSAPDAFQRLVSVISEDPTVALAYGRQLPRPGASPVEAHLREFNYPGVSQRRTTEDLQRMGARGAFASNAFAVYRRSALASVGGFAAPVILAEDWLAAYRLLRARYVVAYVADAVVLHSHDYSTMQEARLFFDIGVSHAMHRDVLAEIGGVTGSGVRFAASEFSYLRAAGANGIEAGATVLARNCARLIGYRMGRAYRRLPRRLALAFTTQPHFWRA